MSTTAKELLGTMRARLSMIEEGITTPSLAVVEATRQLVERLSALPPDERIRIEYTNQPLHVQYIRASTNELVAELWQHGDAQRLRLDRASEATPRSEPFVGRARPTGTDARQPQKISLEE